MALEARRTIFALAIVAYWFGSIEAGAQTTSTITVLSVVKKSGQVDGLAMATEKTTRHRKRKDHKPLPKYFQQRATVGVAFTF